MTSESASPDQPPTPPQTIVCSNCGCVSTLPEYFTNKENAPLCPWCVYKLRTPPTSTLLIILALVVPALLVAIIVTVSVSPDEQARGLLAINIIVLILLMFSQPFVILHEFAHMITTWMLGGRVALLSIGSEPIRFKKKIGNTYLHIGTFTGYGVCYCSFPNLKGIIRHKFWVSIAGLLMHFLIVILLIPFAELSNLWTTFAWREILIGVNSFLFIFNAIPSKIMIGGNAINNDGAVIIQLLKGKISAQNLHAADYIVQIGIALQERDFEQTYFLCEAGLKLYPDNIHMRDSLAYSLLLLHRLNEAAWAYKQIIESEEMKSASGIQQALYYNNAGWSSLANRRDTDSLEFARKCTHLAFKMAPWVIYVRSTYGSLLIEQGNYEEGLEIISEVIEDMVKMKNSYLNISIAENLGYSAIAYHRLGDTQEAEECLKEAVQFFPNAVMVAKAQRIITPSYTSA